MDEGKVLWREKGKRGQGICNGKQQEKVRILKATLVYLLENPRDGRAWWAAVYGVAQSRT